MKLESVTMIDIYLFEDSGILGSCAAANATVHQPSRVNQALISSKCRLPMRELTDQIRTYFHSQDYKLRIAWLIQYDLINFI